MKTFELFDKALAVTDEREAYNEIKLQFADIADEARAEYAEIFNKYSDLEAMLKDFDNQYTKFMKESISTAVTALISSKVYVDENEYFSRLENRGNILNGDDAFASIYDKYVEIVADVEGQKQYREARKNHRGRIIGGGFGVQGAVKGMATAGVMNLGMGALHSIGNFAGNMITKAMANSDKKKLFKDPNTFATLANAIRNDCYYVHITLVDIFNENGRSIKFINKDDGAKASTLFNVIKNPAFPKEETLEKMIEVLELDPYNLDYYIFLLNEFGDTNRQIESIADYFGVAVGAYKGSLVSDYFSKLAITKGSNLDEVLEAGKSVIEFSKSVNGDIPEDVDAEITGFIKTCRYSKAEEYLESLPKSTLEEIRACKEKITQFDTELGKEIQKSYPNEDCEIDLEPLSTKIDKLIDSCIGRMIADLYESLPKNSVEDLYSCKEKLSALCDEIGATANDKEGVLDSIDNDIFDMKVKMLKERFNSLPKSTEEEALATKEKLLAYCKEIGIDENNAVISDIDSTLQQIDKDIRTVEGMEFDTREEAVIARKQQIAIDAIIAKNTEITKGDYMAIITEIDSLEVSEGGEIISVPKEGGFRIENEFSVSADMERRRNKSIKNRYMLKYTGIIFNFDEMLEVAKHYEYKKNSGKKFTGFKNLIKDVTSALGNTEEQEAWEELTHNGQYSLEVVASDSRFADISTSNQPISSTSTIETPPVPVTEQKNLVPEPAKSKAQETASPTQQLNPDEKKKMIVEALSTLNCGVGGLFLGESKIPPKKLANAKKTFLSELGQSEQIYIFYDSTVFGSGKDGFALTDKGFY